MRIESLDEYKNIYAVSSFWDNYRRLFGKDSSSYQREKKRLLTNLNMLDTCPLIELLNLAPFERLTNEDLYVIRHVSKHNPRVIFVAGDDDGNFYLIHSFLEKDRSDYEIAKQKAKDIIKQLQ